MDEVDDADLVVERVAALDLGKAGLEACVRVPHPQRPGRRMQELRGYATTTAQLLAMAAWLRHWHVQRVVMESTSTYCGVSPIAPELACPAETVRGWLRRFGERAEAVRSVFTVWLRAVAPSTALITGRPTRNADQPYPLARQSHTARTQRPQVRRSEPSRVLCTPSFEGRMARCRSGTTRTPRPGRCGWSASTSVTTRPVGGDQGDRGQVGDERRDTAQVGAPGSIHAGEAAGVSSEEKRELRELRWNARSSTTVEILKAVTTFFARECDPRHH